MAKQATSKTTTAPAAKAAPAVESQKKTRARRKKITEVILPPAPADHPELPGVTGPHSTGVIEVTHLMSTAQAGPPAAPSHTRHLERYREPQWRALLYVAHQYETSGGYLNPDCLMHRELEKLLSEGVTVDDIMADLANMGWVCCDNAGPVPYYATTPIGNAVVAMIRVFMSASHDWSKFRPFDPTFDVQAGEEGWTV